MIKSLESISPRRDTQFGDKARALASLSRAGFSVPRGFAIAAWAASGVSSDAMPAAWEQMITEALKRLRRQGVERFCVRSSALDEDRAAFSAAGQYATVLNVKTDRQVLEAILRVWASARSERALRYMKHTADSEPKGVGVVVQALVASDVSGVMFTCNPLTGSPNEVVINANYGLGVTVVEGKVCPDTFRLDKASRQLKDQTIGNKAMQTIAADRTGTKDKPTPPDRQKAPALDAPTLNMLLDLAIRVERHFGDARDIEWALVGSDISVLQARPVTTVGAKPKSKGTPIKLRDKLVWSNVNVGEALPGVATPLTWSVLSGFSELGFHRAFGALGCTVPPDAELVGSFRGRIYLNMTEFFEVLAQVPGIDPTRLAKLGGGNFDELLGDLNLEQSSTGFVLRLPRTLVRYARENFLLQHRVAQFEATFTKERRRLSSIDPRVLSPVGLDQMLTDVEHLLDETGAIMLTVYSNLLVAILTLWGVQRLFGPPDVGFKRDVIGGLVDVSTARPGLALWKIAQQIKTDDVMLTWLESGAPLDKAPDRPSRAALREFLVEFGHRGAREAEIAEPRWRDDPSMVMAALRLHISRGDPEQAIARQKQKREQAEKRLTKAAPLALRPSLNKLMRATQRLTRTREALRDNVVQVLGMYRRVALDVSRRLEQVEPSVGEDAAFFLTIDELHKVLRAERSSVSALVAQRRRQFERDCALPDPPPTFVGFPPDRQTPIVDTDVLEGLSASPGVVEGTARVIRGPQDASDVQADEVLVLPTADSGWSPLFVATSGVVTELGGPLSHAAIVLREYGVPAVVNVTHATRAIVSGDRVRLDGDRGTVQIIERVPRSAD